MGIRIRMRISELREDKGLSRISLARHLDVSLQTLRNWDKGRVMPNMSNIEMMIKIFNCETKDLFEFP